MREIKFRGKQTKPMESIWHYGDLIHSKDNKTYIQNITCMEVDKETVGQFTGLRDKNGVEIYEGDIVETEDYYVGNKIMVKGRKQIIDDIRFCGKLIPCKVIGNVYENPELVEYE